VTDSPDTAALEAVAATHRLSLDALTRTAIAVVTLNGRITVRGAAEIAGLSVGTTHLAISRLVELGLVVDHPGQIPRYSTAKMEARWP
jgi:hypothetical protein